MCDRDIAGLLQLGSTGLRAGTEWQQARYASAMERQNAILASRGAKETREAGAAESTAILDAGRKVVGEQRVALAALGGSEGTRSADTIVGETSYFSQMDAATAVQNADKRATDLETEAAVRKANSKNIKGMAPLQVGSTLLTGGARAYGIYNTLNG